MSFSFKKKKKWGRGVTEGEKTFKTSLTPFTSVKGSWEKDVKETKGEKCRERREKPAFSKFPDLSIRR